MDMNTNMAMAGDFFNPGPFMPHGGCYLWTQSLILLHTLSDGAIGVAYYCIPIILLYFVRRRQPENKEHKEDKERIRSDSLDKHNNNKM